ncbi:MAG: MlaE family ABC transporter permease [Candidatus Marinamargulisbacteria bacterium]
MLSSFGLKLFQKITKVGKFVFFSWRLMGACHPRGIKLHVIMNQFAFIGIYSLPIVGFTALFVGMAFSVQVVKELLRFGAPDLVGGVVAIAIWRELGPLLTGVVIAGRVGAAITAELGSMKVNEQVEALTVMGQDPMVYLAAPRVIALVLFMPLFVGLADIIGFLGGLWVATSTSMINHVSFFMSAKTMLTGFDIVSGFIKGIVFALVISFNATYLGLTVRHGAQDVGKKTMRSVVVSILIIFGLNYVLSVVFFGA